MLNALTIYKSIHVLAAAVWVGGAVAIHVFSLRAIKAGPEHAGYFVKEVGFYGKVVLPAAAILLLIFGFLTLDQEGLSLSDAWVSIGFAVWIVSFAAGFLYFDPTAVKLGKAYDAGGPLDAPHQQMLDRFLLAGRLQLLLLLLVVVDMVVKPS